MYLTIQQVNNKRKVYGYPKEIIQFIETVDNKKHYKWKYSDDKFERPNHSYRIVVKESYRLDGKVKTRQLVVASFSWEDIAMGWDVYIDWSIQSDKLLSIFNCTDDELDSFIESADEKFTVLSDKIEVEHKASEECIRHKEHEYLIKTYNDKRKLMDDLIGSGSYEQVYDIYGKVMDKKLLKEFDKKKVDAKWKQMEQDQAKKDYEQKCYEEKQKSWNKTYEQILNGSGTGTFSEVEKGYLKKFYKVLAKYCHPDNNGGDNDAMVFLNNKLKQQWGL